MCRSRQPWTRPPAPWDPGVVFDAIAFYMLMLLFFGAVAWLFSGYRWVHRLDRRVYRSRFGRFLPGHRAFVDSERHAR